MPTFTAVSTYDKLSPRRLRSMLARAGEEQGRPMEPSIFKFVLRFSLRSQIFLTVMAALSFPFLYAFYELPKQIVNGAIQADGTDFPKSLVPDFIAEGALPLDHLPFLFVLCALFLILVVVNQGFKYYVNVYRGLTGERMLRRLRYELYSRVLRFPLPTFRKVSQGEIIPMITAEVEPLGGFIGEAFSLPAFQGGTLVVIITFLFIQSPLMAVAAIALYPLQMYLIPKLQRRVNLLGKERVRLVRRLSERIGETVQGVQEVHTHDTSNLELANFTDRLGSILDVRYKIYRMKFVIKFLNNFIQQLGPFFFYSIGGYLVITGGLDIGTLIAAIAAQKDLGAPWKELLNYYQRMEDSRIKYEQVVTQFAPAGILDASHQLDAPDKVEPLSGDVAAANVTLTDDQDNPVVDGVSFKIDVDRHVAIVGTGASGKEDLALLMARLVAPNKGALSVNGQGMDGLPEAITGRRISYVDPSGFIFAASFGENLFYGLKHRPMVAPKYEGDAAAKWANHLAEAEAAGNITYDIAADWIDYAAAGVDGMEALKVEALRILRLVDLGPDIYQLGLRGTIDPVAHPELAETFLRARAALRERIADPEIASLVELFDRARYNTNATVGENVLFGSAKGDAFDMDDLAENDYVLSVLDKVGLTETMVSIGYQVAATMVELFADLPLRPRVLPEIQLHQRRGPAGLPGAVDAGRQGPPRSTVGGGPHPPLVAALQAGPGAPPSRPHRRGDADAAPRGALRLRRWVARRAPGCDRVLRRRAIQHERQLAGQYPVRQDRLRRGAGGGTGRHAGLRGHRGVGARRYRRAGGLRLRSRDRGIASVLGAASEAGAGPRHTQAARHLDLVRGHPDPRFGFAGQDHARYPARVQRPWRDLGAARSRCCQGVRPYLGHEERQDRGTGKPRRPRQGRHGV